MKAYKTSDKKGLSFVLSRFVVTEVYLLYADYYWMIKGCGEYIEKGKKKCLESQIEAVYENNDWYFSSLIGASVGFGTKPTKCSTQ